MKTLILTTILLFVSFLFPFEASAKVLPQAKSAGTAKKVINSSGKTVGISVSPKLRRDRKALLVYFSNLQNASNVSYALIYRTEGREEGAGGSVRKDEGSSASRELLFGTCSKNICRYHTNITNAIFEVTGTLASGKSFTKRYRIRI
ncbi:MAG: hypothetical protein HYV37_01550 [Candidatus Levyibacteriota bacterium]|nr:MAG: hypothetical protein HYV37_01550 [Candidatus Levybacteria bacterium]